MRNLVALLILMLSGTGILRAQSPWASLKKKPSTLELNYGYDTLDAGPLRLVLLKSSQTVASLRPKTTEGFDFVPADSLDVRSADGLYHIGDLNLRLKYEGTSDWKSFSTAARRGRVKALPAKGNVLATADLSATLPADIPLQITRYWEMKNGNLVLRFRLHNPTKSTIEIGSLGIPMIFDNILHGRTLEQTHAKNVFYDPYIGQDAGYLQVARLNGQAASLVVVPANKTPFEAYNPLNDDPTPRGIAFEGFYEWMVHSKAYAEQEWKGVEPWNTPTSAVLKAGESREYALQFLLSGTVKETEATLIKHRKPVAIAVPGYVLPTDVEGKLFLKYPQKVRSISSYPEHALDIKQLPLTREGWFSYAVRGKTWGRARLTVTYADGLTQTISYKIIHPEQEVIASYGNFLSTKQWFDQSGDLFKRNPSVITYDYAKQQQVVQENRAWIAGLSDEGGAGSWLGAMMKQLVQPDKKQILQLQHFVDTVMFGRIQVKEGPKKYGVKKSIYYYEPDSMPAGTYPSDINFKTWSAWRKKDADDLGRSYNYPHVAAAHWVLYRLARNYKDLVPYDSWRQHLRDAAETGLAMVTIAPYYAQFGQMEGTVFYLILRDLKDEGMLEEAGRLEAAMKIRADHWRSLEYPFGSEMPWDSTGQEEVYMWSDYFGYTDKADVTLNAILAYMPVIPHWGYNGNARRYWDFLYAGKLSRVERMIHHYGSALNAIPVLTEYRKHPEDFYLLRAGYGGLMGSISNITEDGFAPTAFHAYPSTLKNDDISGDYGSGFFGYAVNTASYLFRHPEFGWLAFGGNLDINGGVVNMTPTTAAKSAVYIAAAGVWIKMDAGTISSVSYDTASGEIKVMLDAANEFTPEAMLRVTSPGAGYHIPDGVKNERAAYVITLNPNTTTEVSMIKL